MTRPGSRRLPWSLGPGRDFETFITSELGAHLIRPDRKDEPARFGRLARQRQWIEAII
jgi:hypothetical protein